MTLPFLKPIEETLASWKDQSGFRLQAWPLAIAGFVLIFVAFLFFAGQVELALSLAIFLSPLWVPVILVTAAWKLWLILIRAEFIASQPTMVLEIKPPRSLVKTPLAMEAVLSSMHLNKGESNWVQKYIQGKTRGYWSLELASIEGRVHLYIWTRAEYRRLIEAAIYAQYPGAQVVEVPDYTRMISASTEDYAVWGCDYKHTAPDPFPIKTYIDYGLDKVQKEPEQVDPFANLIEFMSAAGPGEYLFGAVYRPRKLG